jgi:hypothetical protein
LLAGDPRGVDPTFSGHLAQMVGISCTDSKISNRGKRKTEHDPSHHHWNHRREYRNHPNLDAQFWAQSLERSAMILNIRTRIALEWARVAYRFRQRVTMYRLCKRLHGRRRAVREFVLGIGR